MAGHPICIDCGKPSDLTLNPSGLWCTECEHARTGYLGSRTGRVGTRA